MDGNGQNMGIKSLVAAGDIYPRRIVKLSSVGDFECAQATTGDVPFGIAQQWQRGSPGTPFEGTGVAASAGDEITVYAAGSTCPAAVKRSTGTLSNGDFVGPDTDGKLIRVTSGWAVGQIAESGVTGSQEELRVYVNPVWVGSVGSGS